MRFTIRGTLAALTGALLVVLAGAPAFADDTEIFFNQKSSGASANIMMILDTSGSMDDLVTSTEPYDPTRTYTANKCSGSSFDTKYYYFGTKVPGCTSTSKLSTTQLKCAAMGNLAGSSSGFYTSSWVQWGSSAPVKTTSGKGSGQTTTNTTTYAWTKTLNTANTSGYVECKDDAGVDGDGVDTAKLYPSTDVASAIVTTDKQGNVISSTVASGAQLTGIWDATKNYWTAGSGTAYNMYSANYLNYYYDSTQTSTKSKISIMQTAATNLLNSVGGVNVGLMRYNYSGSGGEVLWPVGDIVTGKASMTSLINSWAPAGITPLSETLYEAYLYYSGGAVTYGKSSTSTKCTSWATNGQCNSATSFSAPSVAAARTPATATGANYNSPASNSCQKNYIVYLTDGLPNEADKADAAIKALGVTCDATAFSGANGGLCTAGLAGYMYQNDLRSDVAGKQNVTSYFIGFGTDFGSAGAPSAAFTYLDKAATAGGGQAFTATSLTELTDVFNQIFSQVLKTNTTFSAPAVAVNAFNRTQTLNDLYFSVFTPKAAYHWPGNVKKYKVVGGNVVDQNGAAAVDGTTGFFKDAAQSYWSSSADGADVTLGGAASNIPDPSTRNVYFYKGSNPSSPAAMTKLTTSNLSNGDLNIGGSGDPALTDLINWTLGQDVRDDNNDGSTTDTRHVMGDPIHTQPTVVTYGKNVDKTDDTVVFTPTNDGYFHAVDGNTGAELWAFIPQEMFQYLKLLYANDTADKKHYALDGAVSVLRYDINGDGTIDATVGDRVILYFGTGRNSDTSRYYAVDVTDKNNPKFMWSIDASVLPGLGQAWAAPEITRVNVSGASQNSQKLALVISGGYDAVEDNTSYVSADSVGTHIYMVDALYGTLLWAAGPTTASGINLVAARMDHSIPSAVTVVDLDSDGYADRMYVGDMAGQLWRFDVWNGKAAASLVTGGVLASLGTKDETTHTAAATRRFYSSPDVAAVVKPGVSPYLNIAIGSGYRGHPLDTGVHDAFYAIRDYSPFAKMTQAQYTAFTLVVDVNSTTSLTPVAKPVDITLSVAPTVPAGAAGWELQMNQHGGWVGEKILSGARTFDGQIFFPTYTPNTGSGVSSACTGVGTGTNREYIVNVYDGSPAIDKNKDGTLTTDERSTDLAQGGIAPETAFLFLPTGQSGTSEVVGLSGAEKVTDKNFDQRRKTYWHDSNGN
jgi:type IV pilus assembly protein PilY1